MADLAEQSGCKSICPCCIWNVVWNFLTSMCMSVCLGRVNVSRSCPPSLPPRLVSAGLLHHISEFIPSFQNLIMCFWKPWSPASDIHACIGVALSLENGVPSREHTPRESGSPSAAPPTSRWPSVPAWSCAGYHCFPVFRQSRSHVLTEILPCDLSLHPFRPLSSVFFEM